MTNSTTSASIYVGVTQNQLKTMAPLIGLFFQQCVDVLGRDLPGPDEKHEVLLLIDEFASLGRMDIIETAESIHSTRWFDGT